MKRLLGIAAIAVCACSHGPVRRDARFVRWQDTWAGPSDELCAFVHSDISGAERVRSWAREHPAQAEQLLAWAAANPGAANMVPSFLDTRSGFSDYRPSRDPAIYAVLYWASLNGNAARELAAVPHGLEAAVDTMSCP
jgi:hypothetical protein